jgi:hypothetical protein
MKIKSNQAKPCCKTYCVYQRYPFSWFVSNNIPAVVLSRSKLGLWFAHGCYYAERMTFSKRLLKNNKRGKEWVRKKLMIEALSDSFHPH